MRAYVDRIKIKYHPLGILSFKPPTFCRCSSNCRNGNFGNEYNFAQFSADFNSKTRTISTHIINVSLLKTHCLPFLESIGKVCLNIHCTTVYKGITILITQASIYGVIVYFLLCHESLNSCPVNIFDY